MASHPAATGLTVVVCGVLGLLIGSFLNVVIYRVPRHRSVVHPGSSCPRCGSTLSGWENVPVLSWLVLRGRCRHCGNPISGRYPLVELATAVSFVALAAAVGPAAALPPLLVVASASIVAAAIDHDGFPLPAAVMIASVVAAAGLLVISWADHGGDRVAWGALGVVVAVVLSWAGCRLSGISGPSAWRLGAISVLAWCGGWLWLPGGLAVALWAAVCFVLSGTVGRPRSDGAPGAVPTRGMFEAWVLPGITAGGLVAVVLSGAWHGP